MADRTPAQELRDAAARLRCDHRHPVQPPEGSFAKPGDCSKCGQPYGGQPVRDDLTGPLAALLDAVGSDMQQERRAEPVTLAEGCALAIARAVNAAEVAR